MEKGEKWLLVAEKAVGGTPTLRTDTGWLTSNLMDLVAHGDARRGCVRIWLLMYSRQPSPLIPGEHKQATTTLHLSVMRKSPSHCFGVYSAPAICCIDRCLAARGVGAKEGSALSNLRSFGPYFAPKNHGSHMPRPAGFSRVKEAFAGL